MTDAAGLAGPAAGSARPPNSVDHPWPVRSVSIKVAQWIDRLGNIWVEGQITQVSARPGARMAFLVLRDPAADMSLTATCDTDLLRERAPLQEGSRVVVYGKLCFFTGRGTISLQVTDIRLVGIGELLARIERLKTQLAEEGLFDPQRKHPIPFLPNVVGVITGRGSAAERDVLTVAQQRWPAVQFTVRNTAVQGGAAVAQIVAALTELDADRAVDVIVLARGGGSVEDLLPFSDETLCRAIAAASTPVVSAIGHEPDNPLTDYVADLRAATPTDAAKRIVPDAVAELATVHELRQRCAAALRGWVHQETQVITHLRSRPILAEPLRMLEHRHAEIQRLRITAQRAIDHAAATAETTLRHLRHQLTALGPAATLARGYAVVQRVSGQQRQVLRTVADAAPGSELRIRVTDGVVNAAALGRHQLASTSPANSELTNSPTPGGASV